MATPNDVFVETYASLVTNYISSPSLIYKNVKIPYTISTLGRIVYFKEASEYPGPSVFAISSLIQNSTMVYLQSNEALTLQCFSTNTWGILGGYPGVSSFSTQVLPDSSQIINLSSLQSHMFVDLRTQSKTVVLPPIRSITPALSNIPVITIKDSYGKANLNPLYISCSVNDTLERSSINNAIGITQNYASIDLGANLFQKKWHILNYYDGTLVVNP
jgi:hypothetical protein